MTRVAIVTGGTRGIGEAISLALKDMGMTVAANYAGNDEKAKAFTDRTGIKAYRWDVGDYDACQQGCAQVAAELGLDIPGDLSVIGVDDLDLVAAALEPGLTTVALPHREMGRWAMSRLLGLIDETDAPGASPLLLECELVERGSVGSP